MEISSLIETEWRISEKTPKIHRCNHGGVQKNDFGTISLSLSSHEEKIVSQMQK